MAGQDDRKDGPRPASRTAPWPPAQVEVKPDPVDDTRQYAASVVSPLRYPGAKRQLVPLIERIIAGNVPPPRLFVEPFCGGATTALRLAGTGVVEHVVLADGDPLVAAFWYTAAFDTTWLIDAMREVPVTVERWKWWRNCNSTSVRDLALKCLFLNRTTFSGILHGWAGPIGGLNQNAETKYKIDCRFNKDALAQRISAVGQLADTGHILEVWSHDWGTSLDLVGSRYRGLVGPEEAVVYLDPPYVEKAPYLYQWSFQDDQHRALAQVLSGDTPFRWLLSYDDNALARALYPPAERHHVLHAMHRYTAAGLKADEKKGKRQRTVRAELLVTNFPDIPESDDYHVVGDTTCVSCQKADSADADRS
ncbi:hypothetical protein Ade02nite_23790 [Paractinoplanes deccanensis]|uniref:Site-specific DNA-methyltransferase (adenine-specific) n=1 Tax=Paractinoplanes deccanensis TaxID=113561 RepID=A0ABQ3Y172_9ACTN|nr:hypothetical protein Ade02nite_23790 [Actinoplanes deccanensis]